MNEANRQIMSIVGEAVEHSSPEERAAFLDKACAGDADRRARVEALLRAYQAAGNFLQGNPSAPEIAVTADAPVSERPGTVIGPYKLMEPLGEGGMGLVFVAEQQQPVRRKVALKVIKPGMDTRQVVARFEAERQALALMDHPNIAKVLEAGATESGRPYFVMELVKGVPITQFCDDNRQSPRDRLELFVDVCAAVQHAHHKGVIHRDIKPSNVMVSSHDGTPVVKVIDFGVAKAVGQQLTEKSVYTALAQLIGTPLYMSPEQAGQSGLDVDTRSDIYSLGVLLYELLTGTTPFDKERFKQAAYDEIRRIIREEEPPKPSTRLSESKDTLASISAQRHMEPAKLTKLVRGELDWIVMKALEKDRNRRYETANGFAMDVQRYLADEPVLACPPSVGYRVRKFARRNKRALAMSAVLAVAVLVVAGTLGWVMRDRDARQARLANDFELAVERAELLHDQEKRPEALAAFERAEVLAGEAALDPAWQQRLAALKDRLDADARDQNFIARFEEIRLQEQSQVNEEKNRFDLEGAIRKIRGALTQYGIEIGIIEPDQAVARISGRPEAMQGQLLAALQQCLSYAPKEESQTRQWLVAVLHAADRDPWRTQVRKSWSARDRLALEKLMRDVDEHKHPPTFLLWLATLRPATEASRLDLLRRIQRAYPNDLWANLNLAWALDLGGRPAEAVRYDTAALALRPHNPRIYLYRARALKDAGELEAALADLRRAIAVAPQYAAAHINLGLALKAKGDVEGAIACYHQALAINPKHEDAHNNLGVALKAKGDVEGAIACYRQALAINPKYESAHINLGNALLAQKKLDEAIACYHKAIEVNPKSAAAHNSLGSALKHQKKLEEAIACYHKAIELDPKYAPAHNNLGLDLHAQNKLDEAIACFTKAIELDPKSALAHNNLGNALNAQGKLDAAVACYQKAIELDPKYAAAHNNLGDALSEQRKLDEAIACYHRAIELEPKKAKWHYNLGSAFYSQKKLDDAIACYRKAIELEPAEFEAHSNLGLALHDQKKLDEAIACYRRAIELAPMDPLCHFNLGVALKERGKLDEAIACYRKAIALDPKYATAHSNLGAALHDQKKLDEAIACYHRAIELDPKYAAAHYNLGNALKDRGKLDNAIACYHQAIKLNPKYADAYINLGSAFAAQKKLNAAIACYRKAIELDPQTASAHYNLGVTLDDQGKHDAAIACYHQAIKLNPKFAEAYINLGSAFRAQKKLNAAIASYRKAIELDPKDVLAHNGLGAALEAQGKLDEAIECYRKAIELDPKDAKVHHRLGQIMLRQGKLDEAIACFRKVIEIDPNASIGHNNLGAALMNKGHIDEAILSIRKAIELNPKSATPYLNLGFALQAQKKLDEAIACYRKAVELDPKDAGALNSLAWILATCADLKLRNPAEAVKLAEASTRLVPQDGGKWNTLGVACYRAGDWKGAIEALNQSARLRKGGDAHDWFFLAMAQQRLDKKAEARKWYDQAVQWMDKHAPKNEELRRFRAEAADLISMKETKGVRGENNKQRRTGN